MSSRDLGNIGEKLALDLLKSKGYKILETNFSTKFGEVDIVAMHQNTLKFIEVKTRKSLKYGRPEEAVNRQKLEKIKTVANIYTTTNNLGGHPQQIEVVSIFLSESNKHMEIIPVI